MKKYIAIIILIVMCDSCRFLYESYPGFAIRNNTNERLICILDYRPSSDSISNMNRQEYVRPRDLNGYFGPYAEEWETVMKDSVYIYLAFYDSLFIKEERFSQLDTKEIKPEALIVRYCFLKSEIYYPRNSDGALWFDFPPSADLSTSVVWYNGHSAADFELFVN